MAVYFVDYESGNDGNDGLSFANRKKLISSFSPAAGDTVRIKASPAPTSLAQNATWTHASATVTLTTAVTTTISDCQTTWTASANVTCTDNTTSFKESTKSQQIAIADGFTTGLAAYFATGTLDLSTRQQVSFKVMQTVGTIGADGAVRLRLCTDTAGATPVHDIPIPNLVALNQWVSVTVDLAGNLNSAIASVSFDVVTDNGAQTFLLDDIIACKASASADSLSLTSLIGYSDSTGAGGSDLDTWYAIASINGTTIKLDNGVNTLPASLRGWSGRVRAIESSTNANPSVITATDHGLVTGDVIELRGHQTNTAINGSGLTVTVVNANTFSVGVTGNGVGGATGGFWPTTIVRTAYKRETTKTTLAVSASAQVFAMPASGSAGSVITYSGGWNRTDMSAQTDETWLDGQNGHGFAIDFQSATYLAMEKVAATRYGVGFRFAASATNISLTTPGANNHTANAILPNSAVANTINAVAANNNAASGLQACVNSVVTLGMACNNLAAGVSNPATNTSLLIGNASNNLGNGVSTSTGTHSVTVIGAVGNTSTGVSLGFNSARNVRPVVVTLAANNGIIGVALGGGAISKVNTYGNATAGLNAGNIAGLLIVDSFMAEATKITGYTAFADQKVFSKNDQGVSGKYYIYGDGFTAETETTVVHTGGGKSWKVSPTSTNRSTSYRCQITLARFAVTSGLTYTVKAWVRRDSVTTLNCGLRVVGGLINGVANDITVSASGSVDTWEELTLAGFTPTESGTVELIGEVWDGTGTTNNAYFDDVTIADGTDTVAVTLDYGDFRFGPGVDPLATLPSDLVLPDAEDVRAGVEYGAGGDEFTGELSAGGGGFRRLGSPIGRAR